jgi:hypothetical protein
MKFNAKVSQGLQVLAVLVAGAAFTISAVAQSTPNDPTVGQRKENQQDRIAQGVKSGQLTSGETSHLEGQETALNHETQAMRAADGGKLTKGDKRVVNRRQNHLSHEIYRDKHNGRRQ